MQACNQHSFKIKDAESAQPRNHSIVTRPSSSREGGVWAGDCDLVSTYWQESVILLAMNFQHDTISSNQKVNGSDLPLIVGVMTVENERYEVL